jgi:CCR4-NOT transcriptional regulation complex NOT5 subunit
MGQMDGIWDEDVVEPSDETKRDAARYICNTVSDVAARLELLESLELTEYA